MSDQHFFRGETVASGHGRISNAGEIALQGSVLHVGSLRAVSDVQAAADVSNLPPEPPHFVEREDELQMLAEVLEQPGRVAVVTGLGGVGKSALALKYAHDRRETAPAWWVAAGSPTEIDNGLANLMYVLQPELAGSLPMAEAARRAVRWLITHHDWLLVLDDVTNPADVDPLLSDLACGHGRTLVTTRLSYGWHRPGTTVIRLGPLAPNAAAALLTELLRQAPSTARPAELSDIRDLAFELGGLPLALTLAGAYLCESGVTVAAYRRLLAEHFDIAGGSDSWARLLEDAISLALAAVADRPDALPLLRVLSWYSHEPVPVDLLLGSSGPAETGVTQALRVLAAHGLVRLGDETVSVHRHVQTLVRTADDRDPFRSAEVIAQALAIATTLLDEYAPPVHESSSWPRWQSLLPHITALADRSAPEYDTPVTAHLLNRTGLFLCEQGNPGGALTFLERSHEAYRHALGDDHHAALAALGNFAGALQAAERIDEAVVTFRQVLDTCGRVLGPDHAFTLSSRADLGGALLARGDIHSAVSLLEDALVRNERAFGTNHPSSLSVTANLAYAHQVAGRPEQAIPLLKRVLDGRQQTLGNNHPSTLVTRHNLASAYHAAGELAQAVPMLEENLSARLHVLGGDHPETLTSRNSLAYALLSAGRLNLALPMLQGVLTDRERVLGPDAPDTITSRSNLAAAFWTNGDLSQAAELFEQTVEDCLKRLGTDHPDTLAARHNLAGVYRATGRYEEALTLFEINRIETERLLGPEHPDTLTARNNLAAAYWENGNLSQALPLLERDVEDCKRLLGDLHPDTLAARANLSLALLNLRDSDLALPLLERAVADYEQVLGTDHPATLTAANNLAGAYKEASRWEEAVTLYELNLERRVNVLGPQHPDVLASRNNLAGAYKETGRREEAITLYRNVLQQCQSTLGDDHPLTRTVRRNLSALTRSAHGG